MDFQFVSHSDFVSESAFVRGFARELWRQREMREMIIPEIQSQIKSLKQIGVEYTFTLDFFPRTGKSLICSQRRISVETSQRMLSIQGYRGTLSAWFCWHETIPKIPILRSFSKFMPNGEHSNQPDFRVSGKVSGDLRRCKEIHECSAFLSTRSVGVWNCFCGFFSVWKCWQARKRRKIEKNECRKVYYYLEYSWVLEYTN